MTHDPTIETRDDGFEIRDSSTGECLGRVSWKDVVRIETYKLDLLTIDCICLRFASATNGELVEVMEDWRGFEMLRCAMEAEFSGISGGWFARVMKPPFESNNIVLFERATSG